MQLAGMQMRPRDPREVSGTGGSPSMQSVHCAGVASRDGGNAYSVVAGTLNKTLER
jgi:hypothetical protein